MPLKPPASADDWKITDEWGIYDPEKAGIPALFRRLGRPVLRAAPSSSKRERRRAHRPERTNEGVGLALAEAKRRAGYDTEDEMPMLGGNPARAMRVALKARAAVNAVGTPAESPFVPPPAEPPPPAQHARAQVPPVEIEAPPATAPAPRRRARKVAAPAAEAHAATTAHEPATATAAKPRARRTTRRARTESDEVTTSPAMVEAAPAPTVAVAPPLEVAPEIAVAPPVPSGPPAPSPRRPRGPVPLAAWARAVHDTPKAEPVRTDKRGFWRSLFRIPAEVALVEYAHGCRIHRLLVEAGDDHLPDFI